MASTEATAETLKEKAEPENQEEEEKKPLNPPEVEEAPQKLTSVFEVATALQRTQTFSQKLRKVAQKNPPTTNPGGYFAAVFGLCCAGTTVGLGLCCCVGFFVMLEIIPIVGIVVGAIFWDRDRYCTAENIPLLLVIGGVMKVLHLTFSSVAGKEKTNAVKYIEKFSKRRSISSDVEAYGAKGEEKVEEKGEEKESGEGNEENPGNEEAKPKEEEEQEKVEEKVWEIATKKSSSSLGPWFRLANALLTVANLTWFITASVIIYSLYFSVEYERTGDNLEAYCHKGLYRFAFWYITFFYILLGLIIFVPLLICCCGCLALCFVGSSD